MNNYDINYSNVYSIIYDANGGTGGHVIPDIAPGSIRIVLPLEDTEIERIGYRFIEWNTEPDGGGISYQPDDSITINNDVILYAQWRAEGEYNVRFEGNGGSYIENQIVTIGETVTRPADPTKQGYVFEGWYTDDGTFLNEWNFDTPITNDLTLYAKWAKDPNYKECNCIWIFTIFIMILFLEKIIGFVECKCKCEKLRKKC